MELEEIRQISAKEAFTEISENNGSFLIDVRSEMEWNSVGIPDLEECGNNLILVEYQSYPTMAHNSNFLKELENKLRDEDVKSMFFMCKAGVRSQAAAIDASVLIKNMFGEITVYNIIDGFEGKGFPIFGGKYSGWKNLGLPWKLKD